MILRFVCSFEKSEQRAGGGHCLMVSMPGHDLQVLRLHSHLVPEYSAQVWSWLGTNVNTPFFQVPTPEFWHGLVLGLWNRHWFPVCTCFSLVSWHLPTNHGFLYTQFLVMLKIGWGFKMAAGGAIRSKDKISALTDAYSNAQVAVKIFANRRLLS